jgi:acetyl-CoA synthetase
MDGPSIEDYLDEERTFPPSDITRSEALVNDESLYDKAADRLAFWAEQARALTWFESWETVLEWQLPFAKWFVGGKLNVAYNCLDRHVEAGLGERVAYHFEGEPGDTRTITYAELLDEVGRCANALHSLGVERGDRVAIYMPMIPELPVAMLACARVGAVHSVVFGGFSAEALRERIEDAGARVLITADGGWRRGQAVRLKANADLALIGGAASIEHVIVVRRLGDSVDDVVMADGRDLWWHDIVARQDAHSPPETMDSEDLLFLLYTSGTTARPKGIMHTSGGYLTQVAFTHKYVFDHVPERDVFWCAADIGWATGHSYIVYGPLANGATSVLYEGTPDHPGRDRWWSIIERYGVTILYAAPTAIRTFMKWGAEHPAAHDLTSLRVLGSVGEPINPEAWVWYHENIGGGRCPVLDTWWQTETGAIMIAPLPGVTTLKPGSATFPLPGISAQVTDESGTTLTHGGGYLTLSEPWPAMLRGIYGDPERYRETYWSRFPGSYFAGVGAKRDADGYFWLLGPVDDVRSGYESRAGHGVEELRTRSVAPPSEE